MASTGLGPSSGTTGRSVTVAAQTELFPLELRASAKNKAVIVRYERPGFAGGFGFESLCQFVLVEHGVVMLLGLGRRDVADGLHQPAIVDPVDSFQRRKLDGFE